jgi:hypothetical protein
MMHSLWRLFFVETGNEPQGSWSAFSLQKGDFGASVMPDLKDS